MNAPRGYKARDGLRELQPVLDRLSVQVCVFDSAMTVIAANEAFCVFADSIVANTLGADGGEMHAGAAWGLVLVAAGDDASRVRAGVGSVKRGESTSYVYEYAVRIAGRQRFFRLRAQRCELASETAILIEQTETTAHKLFEACLLRAQRAQCAELLAAAVAHDINELLLAIDEYADPKVHAGDSTRKTALQEITRATKGVAALTQQLLALRPDAVRSSTVSINQTITQLAHLLGVRAGPDIQVELNLDEQVGRVQSEGPLIRQILISLVDNACEAMRSRGRIVVSTHNLVVDAAVQTLQTCNAGDESEVTPPGHWVVLRVRDTGRGMDEQTAQHACDPLFTTKLPDEGAGIGLWCVREIVRRAGGRVRIVSEKGRGTTVEVCLPGLDATAAQVLASSLAPGGRRATILVVEDNTAVRELLQRILRGAGHHVLVAASPGEARAISESSAQPIHLLLTDVVTSDLTGPLLARELRQVHPELAVVWMSGYSGATSAQCEQWLPGAACLERPFTARHVLRTVQEALAARSSRGPRPGTP